MLSSKKNLRITAVEFTQQVNLKREKKTSITTVKCRRKDGFDGERRRKNIAKDCVEPKKHKNCTDIDSIMWPTFYFQEDNFPKHSSKLFRDHLEILVKKKV